MRVYGPVPSRRLGRSLGVDLIPAKTCNFSCVYCQLGRTLNLTNTRQSYFPREELLDEVAGRIQEVGVDQVDFVTLVGDGEPTLSLDLGWVVREVKNRYPLPVAVITNGALLYDPTVRDDLSGADVVLPTLDAGTGGLFRRVNRPHKDLEFERVLDGMVAFRDGYSGEIWLEVMVVAGLNDDDVAIGSIRAAVERVRPDRVYINVPIRPPAEPWVRIPSRDRLEAFRAALGEVVDISLPEEGTFVLSSADPGEIPGEIVEIVKRHPMREGQVLELLERKGLDDPKGVVDSLVDAGDVRRVEHGGVTFLEWRDYKWGGTSSGKLQGEK
ncbi:MAG: radical SAM protein [Promethearchaeota archaeon]